MRAESVVKFGYLKKLKTSRRKFFVLRAESAEASARLEYYDSERKWSGGQPPKRSIPLRNCFNINRRLDTKHKHVIALYTKDDCFCVVLDSEEEAEGWLRALLRLQHGEEVLDGAEAPKPTFEHVWQVTVLNRGLGNAGLTGNYRLCLTDKNLTLIKRDCEVPQVELNLSNIRSCGSLRDFFLLEVGRSSTLGAGELWMQTEDSNIAQNVHSTVFHAMTTNSSKEELGPKSRTRSSSATESSKPTSETRKIHTNMPYKGHVLPQDVTHCADPGSSSQHYVGMSGGRERCDSMPSRARTTSEGTHPQPWNQGRHTNPYRPPSLYGRDISHSPPTGSPVSPPSVGCSTDSAGSSYSLTDDTDVCTELDPVLGRYGHSLTPDEAIAEEDCPDSPPFCPNYASATMHSSDDGYVDMSPRGHHHNHSPTASLSSVTSGTPSTDMKFAEYPLEKVASYLTSEDDGRPARAYSVGSKPERYKNGENLRDRAMSLGSKVKKIANRVLPPHGYHPHQGAKSSSAPILLNSRGQGSHNSIGAMEDLMEMDFSRSGSVNNSGYMDMKPGPKINSGYVAMKPGRAPDTSPYVDMSQGSSPAKPSYISPPPDGFSDVSNEYMEMNPRKNNKHKHRDDCIWSKGPSTHYANYNAFASLPDPNLILPHTPEGYVEMSLGRGHQRQSSLDSANVQIVNEDYANLSMGKKRERTTKRREKGVRSQPIAIQNPGGNASKPTASSSSPRYSLIGRKLSAGAPPTTLPLAEASSYTSLPRRSRGDSCSSGSATPSGSSTIFPFSPCSPVRQVVGGDSIPMDLEHSNYVNHEPEGQDDYAVMRPGVGVQSPSTRMSSIHISDSSTFRPIRDENPADKVEKMEPPYEVLRTTSSRPSSTSSELCSSSSTIVGSRPESVNSDKIRPGSVQSVSSDKAQLHYASLDLDDGNRSPRAPKDETGAGTVAAAASTTPLTYAAIDFVKSGNINAKVKQ